MNFEKALKALKDLEPQVVGGDVIVRLNDVNTVVGRYSDGEFVQIVALPELAPPAEPVKGKVGRPKKVQEEVVEETGELELELDDEVQADEQMS